MTAHTPGRGARSNGVRVAAPIELTSSLASFLVAISVLIFLYNLVISWKRGEVAGDDPWGGNTLEWATSSPPPPYTFEQVPPVRSYMPLRDLRAEREQRLAEGAGIPAAGATRGSV